MAIELTMADLEKKFGEVFEKKMAAMKDATEAEKKAAVEEEKKKTALRAGWYEVVEQFSKIADDRNTPAPDGKKMFGEYCASAWKSVAEKKTLDKESILDSAKAMFPESKALHGIMQKDLQANIPSAGGFGIPQILAPTVIDFLYANTILDKLGATKIPMPNGNMMWPRIDDTSTTGWDGEITGGNPTQPQLGDAKLSAHKLFAYVVMSNSLLRYNTIGVDALVSRDLQRKARITLDQGFLYGAGNAYQPKGIANQGIQTTGSTSTAIDKTTPIAMMQLLYGANVPMIDPRWVIHPVGKGWIQQLAFASGPWAWAAEMAGGKLNGAPFVESTSVNYNASGTPYADFFVMDASEILWGVGYDMALEVSREASYVGSDGKTYSAFQRDETVIRLIAEHDFNVKHPVSFVQGQFTA